MHQYDNNVIIYRIYYLLRENQQQESIFGYIANYLAIYFKFKQTISLDFYVNCS